MSLLPEWKVDDRRGVQFLRRLRQILTGGDVGLRWGDNIGVVVEGTYNSDRLPLSYKVPGVREVPAMVLCRARRQSTGLWTWCSAVDADWLDGGTLQVDIIDGLGSNTDYDVVFYVLRS